MLTVTCSEKHRSAGVASPEFNIFAAAASTKLRMPLKLTSIPFTTYGSSTNLQRGARVLLSLCKGAKSKPLIGKCRSLWQHRNTTGGNWLQVAASFGARKSVGLSHGRGGQGCGRGRESRLQRSHAVASASVGVLVPFVTSSDDSTRLPRVQLVGGAW